jgi:3-oxoacyl-(acyl-carrier-protein) synthase
MGAFIRNAVALSPQNTFGAETFLQELVPYTQQNALHCLEPVYRDFLDPMASRRMSRIVKMGVCCALKCLAGSDAKIPDAIITGTSLGCLEDTEKFLESIYANEENLLNPTPFIQSTHNTVAGAIALALQCHQYNATYTQRGFSFESALADALLLLEEDPQQHILTGGFDELTPHVLEIFQRLGLTKTCPSSGPELPFLPSRGSLPGEGVTFFVLSGSNSSSDMAYLRAMVAFPKPNLQEEVEQQVMQLLREEDLALHDIDLVMTGMQGDTQGETWYDALTSGILKGIPATAFKHLCGEYDTASAFALWLAAMVLKNQHVPPVIQSGGTLPEKIRRILIYNHVRQNNHVLYLVESC